MKEITLDDLKVLVESLEDEETPTIQPEHKTLVDDGVREIQENVKDLYKEIKENQKKIDEQVILEQKTLLEESVKKLPDLKEQRPADPLLSDKIDSLAELQANQKLLISRLQRQLGSLGGGGELNSDGFEYVSDKNLESNPITLVADTWTKVTNDGASSSTKRNSLPEGVTRIYDVDTDRIKLDQLPTTGWLIFRFGVKVNPNVDNVTLKARIAYTLPDGFKFYLQAPGALLNDGAGIEYEEQFTLTFYVGDQDTKDGYGELEVRADGTGSITDCAFMTIVG